LSCFSKTEPSATRISQPHGAAQMTEKNIAEFSAVLRMFFTAMKIP
jgi:hypothetical protein